MFNSMTISKKIGEMIMEYSFRKCTMEDFNFLFELKKQNFKKYVDMYWEWNDEDQKERLKKDLEEHLSHKNIIFIDTSVPGTVIVLFS